MDTLDVSLWGTDWIWSLPLILLNLVIHVFCLVLINDTVIVLLNAERRRLTLKFIQVMSAAMLLIVLLHAAEAATWAVTYRFLGGFPDYKTAMLYSLGAITAYGHADVYLQPQWQMMGVLESLTGVIVLGLTTAFLFAIIQSVLLSTADKPR